MTFGEPWTCPIRSQLRQYCRRHMHYWTRECLIIINYVGRLILPMLKVLSIKQIYKWTYFINITLVKFVQHNRSRNKVRNTSTTKFTLLIKHFLYYLDHLNVSRRLDALQKKQLYNGWNKGPSIVKQIACRLWLKNA